jgi:hypothetical protein
MITLVDVKTDDHGGSGGRISDASIAAVRMAVFGATRRWLVRPEGPESTHRRPWDTASVHNSRISHSRSAAHDPLLTLRRSACGRTSFYGLSNSEIARMTLSGRTALPSGKPFPTPSCQIAKTPSFCGAATSHSRLSPTIQVS